MGREGADTMGGPYAARRVEVERGVVRAGWRGNSRTRSGLCGSAGATAGMASLAACSTGNGAFSRAWKSTEIGGEGADRLVRPYSSHGSVACRAVGEGHQGGLESRPQARKPAPHRTRHGGHGKSKPRRTRRTRRWEERGRLEVERAGVRGGWHSATPYVWRVCCSAGVTAGMASLAACSTRNGAFSRVWKSTEIGGEGADRLGRPYKARHWVKHRAVGKGDPGRLESRPQARKPAPHRMPVPQEQRSPRRGGKNLKSRPPA